LENSATGAQLNEKEDSRHHGTIATSGKKWLEDAMLYQSQCLRTKKSGMSQTRGVIFMGIGLCLGALSPSTATAVTATEAVKNSFEQVVGVLEDKELKKADRTMERRQRLQKIFNDRFSYEEMSKRSLGAHWNKLNETQRRQFVDLFRELLARSYTGTIEGYSGERFQYLSEHTEGDYAEVRTKLLSRKGEIPIDYRLLSESGEWEVYDIVVDGVSMVSNYRAQFTKIIRTSSYEDLVKKLQNKSEVFKPVNEGPSSQ
jgi:phospholipid transport system substrate-binding protein